MDKEDHFLTGLAPFMSRELSRTFGFLPPPDRTKLVLHFEPSDVKASLCLESEELALDGITWAVGMETSDRLGLNEDVPLDVE